MKNYVAPNNCDCMAVRPKNSKPIRYDKGQNTKSDTILWNAITSSPAQLVSDFNWLPIWDYQFGITNLGLPIWLDWTLYLGICILFADLNYYLLSSDQFAYVLELSVIRTRELASLELEKFNFDHTCFDITKLYLFSTNLSNQYNQYFSHTLNNVKNYDKNIKDIPRYGLLRIYTSHNTSLNYSYILSISLMSNNFQR